MFTDQAREKRLNPSMAIGWIAVPPHKWMCICRYSSIPFLLLICFRYIFLLWRVTYRTIADRHIHWKCTFLFINFSFNISNSHSTIIYCMHYWGFTLNILNLVFLLSIYLSIYLFLQLSPFLPITLPCLTNAHFPLSIFPHNAPPVGFVHGFFIHVPWWPFPSLLPLSPPTCPLVTVSLFVISVSLALFCLLVCFVD